MGQRFFASFCTRGRYEGGSPTRAVQISASSMWECPFLHHWWRAIRPRVLSARSEPSGPGVAKYSEA